MSAAATPAADDTATALLVVDVLDDFDHEDGDALLRAFADRVPAMREAIAEARRRGWPVLYVNDDSCDEGDPEAVVRRAREGAGGAHVAALVPGEGEPLMLKPRYSAFDATPLASELSDRGIRRVVIMGAVAEMCVLETASDALAAGFEVVVAGDASVPLASDRAVAALRRLERDGARVARAGG